MLLAASHDPVWDQDARDLAAQLLLSSKGPFDVATAVLGWCLASFLFF